MGLMPASPCLSASSPTARLHSARSAPAWAWSKSRAFRILSTLKHRGFVDQPLRGGPYRLGEKLGMMANTFVLFRALPLVARPVMEQLSRSVRGTVVLRVPDGSEQLTLACIHSPEVLRTSYPVGALHPMTYGSTGRLCWPSLLETWSPACSIVCRPSRRRSSGTTCGWRVDVATRSISKRPCAACAESRCRFWTPTGMRSQPSASASRHWPCRARAFRKWRRPSPPPAKRSVRGAAMPLARGHEPPTTNPGEG